MSWFQIWTICWQVAVFLTPLLMGCAVLWLKAQFVTKIEFTGERNRIDGLRETDKIERDQRYNSLRDTAQDHEARLRVVETTTNSPPSRHTLNNAITALQGGVHSLGRSVDDLRHQSEARDADIRRQMETLNSYLHTMIEKHLS